MERHDIPDCPISKYRWASNWIDYTMGNHGGSGFVLQVKRNRLGKLSFKIRWHGGVAQITLPYGCGLPASPPPPNL